MFEAAIIIIGVAIQYAFVLGVSYAIYRFQMMRSCNLGDWRVMSRFFGVFAVVFVLSVSIIHQLVVPEFWATPFLLSLWTIGVFFVHDVALGLAMKTPFEGETRCRKCGYILRGITEPRCPECGEKT